MNLLIATRNQHKLDEIRTLLELPNLEIGNAFDFPGLPEIEEDGATFIENATKKAVETMHATHCAALADDSGLVVDALDGAPGIFSARYAGEHADYPANNEKLLREMDGKENRTARFICAMALATPDGTVHTLEAACEGHIAHDCKGVHGFGYDPLFIPSGYTCSFGELEEDIKARISHRALALQRVKQEWAPYLSALADDSLTPAQLQTKLNQLQAENTQLKQQLTNSTSLLKATLNQLPVIICGIDSDGGIVFLNQELERVTGYTPRALSNRPDIADYIFPDHTNTTPDATTPSSATQSWTLLNANGQERNISWSDVQDCPIPGWKKWKVGVDITHLKQLERLRDDVEHIIRHDLKSPLGAIIGLSTWLLRDQTLTDSQRSALDTVASSGARMLSMLENSLTLYKIEAGLFQCNPVPVNLVPLLNTIQEDLAEICRQRKVRIETRIADQDLSTCQECMLPSMEQLLNNALSNLIQNAVEASGPNQTVTIRVLPEPTCVRIDIHNSTPIPESIRSTFFDRFVTCGKKTGTGLGTYSAKLITHALGGTLCFTTDEQTGTHLLLTLPR